jgi:transcription initiation factor TFIIH subunit 2
VLLHEDESGRLCQVPVEDERQSELIRRRLELRHKARGLIRSIVILIDLSERALAQRDFGCPRIRLMVAELHTFLNDFFDQNPISQISIVATYNGQGHILTPLCGSPDVHLSCIDNISTLAGIGEPSIQNSLAVSANVLKSAAPYSTREILVLYGSLNTSDVSPIDHTIKFLTAARINVTIIGFGASVYVLSRIATETGGQYHVPLDADHFRDILRASVEPPAWASGQKRLDMVPFGFVNGAVDLPAFDLSELRTNREALPKVGGFSCPKCGVRVFAIPVYCPSCSLLLLTPNHITRCLVHLHELEAFLAVWHNGPCSGCQSLITGGDDAYQCEKCESTFCAACSTFMHDQLHHCPVCLGQGIPV